MIPEYARIEIMRRIKAAEEEHDVRVLYAVESGSRAWGFASPNSDFDVRFIYVHPKEWYLTIDLEGRRDVIEYPIVDEMDISGWDIRKALKLFSKSNPAMVEWLQSSIVYVDDGVFADSARRVLKDVYSIEKGIYHYRSMAKSNYRGYLRADIVPIKKYFYVLKPLLSIMWLEKNKEPAPIEFHVLREMVQGNELLNAQISELLVRKMASEEKEIAASIPVLNQFIESELKRLDVLSIDKIENVSHIDMLNEIFMSALLN